MISFWILIVAGVSTVRVATTKASLLGSPTKCKLAETSEKNCSIPARFTSYSEAKFNVPICDAQIVDTVDECAVLCARRRFNPKQGARSGSCRGFYFDSKARICQLTAYTATRLIQYGYIAPSGHSSKVFYDRTCYKCGAACDQPYGAQLLDNAGFESTLLGPWNTKSGRLTTGHNSAQAFSCYNHGGYFRADCVLSQAVNQCLRETYLVEFEYLFSEVPRHRRATITVDLAEFYLPPLTIALHSNSTQANSSRWQTARAYYQAKRGGDFTGPYFTIGAFNQHQAVNAVSIDNVKVARVPPPTFAPEAVSVLRNGDFESGALEPWTVHPYNQYQGVKHNTKAFSIVSPGLNGSSYAIGYGFKAVNGSFSYNAGFLQQVVSTKPGTVYIFSFRAQLKNIWGVYIHLGPPGYRIRHFFKLSRKEETVSIPIYAKFNQTSIEINAQVFYYGTNSNITLDNLSMTMPKNGPFL